MGLLQRHPRSSYELCNSSLGPRKLHLSYHYIMNMSFFINLVSFGDVSCFLACTAKGPHQGATTARIPVLPGIDFAVKMYFSFLLAFHIGRWLLLSLSLSLFFGDLLAASKGIEANGRSRAAFEDGGGLGGQEGYQYDVFLSFRGPDTRFDFADVLYEFMITAGIHVFRDYEEMRCGDEIAVGLRQAIYDSKIYVVIFSVTYAWSSWCLRELTMIAKCCSDSQGKGKGKIIMPIFHHVDPDDVKLRTSLYREAIAGHRLKYEADTVQEWEDALKTVAHIRGWESDRFDGLGKLTSHIVRDVEHQLRIRERDVPYYLTGINDQVEGVMGLLDRDAPDIRFIFVHGMGGIGKTTLANIVFNKICSWFEGSSFVPKVRELSPEKLMKKLLADILNAPRGKAGKGFDGINQMKRRFCNKKVLIVLDDVNRTDQLGMFAGHSNYLGAGSRILITTRNAEETKIGLPREAVHTFEMKLLDEHHSLQLFARHALGTDIPPPDLLNLSMEIVRATGNLPLAIETVAEQLYQSKDWRGAIEKLKQVPHKKVIDALNLSYQELDFQQKQIFLDIACFPNMMRSRDTAVYMWEACKFYPVDGINVLLNKSLMKIVHDEFIWMHAQLQAVGREIVHQDSPLILRNRSRLWKPEDAWTVVQSKVVSENVVAINLGRTPEDRSLARENFAGLLNLRYLELCGGNLEGDFGGLFSQLKWLCWRNCPGIFPATNLKMEHLTVLQISGLKIRDRWLRSLMACNLKVLELSDCIMMTTPDVSSCPRLERMILRKNRLLKEIHPSLGKLQGPIYLEIKACPLLRTIPPEIRFYSWDQTQPQEIYPQASPTIPCKFQAIVPAALRRLYASLRASTQAQLKRQL